MPCKLSLFDDYLLLFLESITIISGASVGIFGFPLFGGAVGAVAFCDVVELLSEIS